MTLKPFKTQTFYQFQLMESSVN